jgi:hypothetical protein
MDNLQIRANGEQAVLLLGKLESAHWSAAIETDPLRETIAFDIACRFTREPNFLGSSYSIDASPTRSNPRLPNIEVPVIEDGIRRALEVNERQMIIHVFSHHGPLPRTVRWKYVLSFPGNVERGPRV